MSERQNPADRVKRIIEDYIKPNSHLLAMERLHQNFTGEDREFTNWSEVSDCYLDFEWSIEDAQEFAMLSKQIIEGVDEIAETYFRIVEPINLDLEEVRRELDRSPYEPDEEGSNRSGFEYEVVDGIVDGRYIYTDVDTVITYSGGVDDYISEGAIEFRIDPENDLLILESTSVVDVQKTKSYFSKKTRLEITVYSNLTARIDIAEQQFNRFIESFEEGSGNEEPLLMSLQQVSLYNPDGDNQELLTAEFGGHELRDNPEIKELLDEGWIPKGGELVVQYQGEFFHIKFSSNQMMAYIKITEFRNFKVAHELMDRVRGRFLRTIKPL